MNRIKIYALGLCLLAMLSCNNDDKDFLNVGKDGKTSVECSYLDQLVEIPVESSSNWTASLPEDCDWATILTPKGGSGALRLVVDMNNSSEDYTPIKRTTTVTVKCGDHTSTIGLTQFVGDSASDPGSNSEEGELAANKGLGKGFNLLNNRSKGQIFNVNIIPDFKDNDEIRQAFNVTPVTSASDYVMVFDSIEIKKDTIGVKLSVTVSYGCFKVEIEGEYNSYEKKASNNFKYGQVSMMPRAMSKLEVLDLVAIYEENEELKPKTKEEEEGTKYNKSIEGIFTAGFKKIFNKVKETYAIKEKDPTKFKNAVTALVNGFGPVVVTGATLGGQVSMNVQADTTNVSDILNIKGKATVAIKAMVSVDAGVMIKYAKEGTALLKKSLINSYVQGGSGEAISKVTSALQSSTVDMDAKKINEAVAEWKQTIVYDNNKNKNKTEAIEYEFTGIWNLFPYDMQEDMRAIIVELYKDKKAMLDIENLQLSKDPIRTKRH